MMRENAIGTALVDDALLSSPAQPSGLVTDSVQAAIETMRLPAIRRMPVVEDGRPIGIVSLGDLAEDRDPDSLPGAISAVGPDH
jgi:predicted transcriptional regulator